MKKSLLVLLIALSVFFSGCSIPFITKKDNTEYSRVQIKDLSIEVPTTWERKETDGNIYYYAKSSLPVFLMLQTSEVETPLDDEGFETIQEAVEESSNYETLSSEKISVNGLEVYKMISKGEFDGFSAKITNCFLKNDSTLYTISSLIPDGIKENYSKQFDHIFSSVFISKNVSAQKEEPNTTIDNINKKDLGVSLSSFEQKYRNMTKLTSLDLDDDRTYISYTINGSKTGERMGFYVEPNGMIDEILYSSEISAPNEDMKKTFTEIVKIIDSSLDESEIETIYNVLKMNDYYFDEKISYMMTSQDGLTDIFISGIDE